MKDRAPGGGMDKADEVAPRDAMLNGREGALALKTPDVVQDRLEADAVLVARPQLALRLWESGRHLPQQGAQAGLELSLGYCVSPHVAGPRFQPAGAQPSQGAPAQMTADVAAQALRLPAGDGPSAPAVAPGMGARPGCSQRWQV